MKRDDELDAPMGIPVNGGLGAGIAPMAIPLVPILQGIPVVQVPAGYGANMSPQVWGIIAAAQSFTIRQHVKLLPKKCLGCPPCVAQENTYTVYAGLGQDNRAQLFHVDEVSNDWNRCCCAMHPLKLEMRQHIPTGEEMGSNEYSNDVADLTKDWGKFTGNERAMAEKEAYAKTPVAFTMIRDGTQFPLCCNKCVGCFICTSCCADGMTLVAGGTNEQDDKEIGAKLLATIDPAQTIGSAEVPVPCGGCCTPTLLIKQGAMEEPFAKVEGPMCFGGCSEFCCDFNFPVSSIQAGSKAGDLGQIVKTKPDGLAGVVKEAMTDADVFTIEFKDPNLSPEQKALFMSSTLLTDYTYFEGAGKDKCGVTPDGTMYINLCNCYCGGVLCPCALSYNAKDN